MSFVFCAECQNHYGDNASCDEGKPVNSPHRKLKGNQTMKTTVCVTVTRQYNVVVDGTASEVVEKLDKRDSQLRALLITGTYGTPKRTEQTYHVPGLDHVTVWEE